MIVYISGANGFIGSTIFKLLKEKYSVKIIERDSILPKLSADDVLVLAHAAVASGRKDVGMQELFEANVLYTNKLIQHFKHSKVIYLSTASIYCNSKVINNNSEINPKNSYSISKYWGELVVQTECQEYYILRLSSVYGEGMKEGTLIPNYVTQFLSKNSIEVWGKGERTQNFIHVHDVVRLIELLIDLQINRKGLYLCVDNKEYSNFEMAMFVTENNRDRITFIGIDTTPSLFYDNSKTKNIFGWEPKTTLENGVKRYIEWKKKQS